VLQWQLELERVGFPWRGRRPLLGSRLFRRLAGLAGGFFARTPQQGGQLVLIRPGQGERVVERRVLLPVAQRTPA
jgi:hypothetical protein